MPQSDDHRTEARSMARKVFEWDQPNDANGNLQHIARHRVTAEEAEQIVRNTNNETVRSDSSTYPITFGRTKTGKYLAVIWFAVGSDPEVVRVVTAYPVPKPKRRR
jgi:uncharacterized DUF497 family protein